MKATQQLKDDHESILTILSAMEKINLNTRNGKELDIMHYEKLIEFIKVFADKGHHGKEEDLLFPAMEKKGFAHDNGPIGVMLNEHQIGRSHIKALSEALSEYKSGNKKAIETIISHSGDYINLLKHHIDKENNILFTMADKAISELEQEKLSEAFKKIEEERIGLAKQTEFINLVNEMRLTYL
jgi:hemerythrin-like domain-containing protein